MARSLFITAPAAAGLVTGCCGPMAGRWDHMNYGCSFGGMTVWILFVVVIAVVAYFIIKSLRTKTTGTMPQETALDILKRRYARGEITKEDYDKIRRDIDA